VLDNLSAHKTKDVETFLAEHSQVRFHSTPTYSSWLNQVELWFAKMARCDLLRHLHLGRRSRPETTPLDPRLFQIGQALPLDLHRPLEKNCI
jgi:hypothetical protein